MTKKSDVLWYEEQTRQAPIAILMIIFNVLKSIIRTWWPFILILIFRSNFISPDNAKITIAIVAIIVILVSVWRYFRFYFFLSDNKLHVYKGILTRTKLDIPFDRIQSITFEQNVVHQLFNVARIKIDTAGSSGEEFEFAALDLKRADELRTFILSRKTGEETDLQVATTKEQGKLMLNLSISDLLKVGISQNHFRTTGIVVAFLLGLRDRIKESLGDQYVDRFDSLAERLLENIVVYGLGLFVLILVLSFFGTLIYSVLRYYDLHLWKTRGGYKMESGLFNRREQVARDQKLQVIRWITNPLRDIFGIVHLRFFQASSGKGSSKTSISVPGVPKELLGQVLRFYFGRSIQSENTQDHGVHSSFFVRRLLYIVLLPCTVLLGLGLLTNSIGWFVVFAFWLLVGGLFQYYQYKKWRYFFYADGLVTIAGVLERVHKVLLHRKVQGVRLKQSPYQRRKNLATIVLHSASGDVKIPYVQMEYALEMKNYILYKVESSRLKWM
ncbi:MAG: PH domain-containing protein [Saprospiraceae bacterium]|nr:PH domain-containing protein [Saprospiraceae bacterium]